MPRPALKYLPVDTSPPAEQSPFWGGALRVEEACEQYGFTRSLLWELMKAGEVAWSRAGRARVIARRDIVAYLERQRGV